MSVTREQVRNMIERVEKLAEDLLCETFGEEESQKEPVTELVTSWGTYIDRVNQLADRIISTGKTFTKILAVGRGGYIPAQIIAYQLGIKGLDAVLCVRKPVMIAIPTFNEPTREVEDTGVFTVRVENGSFNYHLEDLLVVDSICDTGSTFKALVGDFSRATYCSVYAKPRGIASMKLMQSPLLHVVNVPDAWWVKFPWEMV